MDDPADEEVLQLGRRRPPWLTTIAAVAVAGVVVAAVVAVARHRTHHSTAHPVLASTATQRPLAAGALVVADQVGVGMASTVNVAAPHVTIGFAVVNTSPSPVTPVYPFAVTVDGQTDPAAGFAGLYAEDGQDSSIITAATPRLTTLARGQLANLVAEFDVPCQGNHTTDHAPTIAVALKGLRGTARFDLDQVGQGWAAVRTEACQPTHG